MQLVLCQYCHMPGGARGQETVLVVIAILVTIAVEVSCSRRGCVNDRAEGTSVSMFKPLCQLGQGDVS